MEFLQFYAHPVATCNILNFCCYYYYQMGLGGCEKANIWVQIHDVP